MLLPGFYNKPDSWALFLPSPKLLLLVGKCKLESVPKIFVSLRDIGIFFIETTDNIKTYQKVALSCKKNLSSLVIFPALEGRHLSI